MKEGSAGLPWTSIVLHCKETLSGPWTEAISRKVAFSVSSPSPRDAGREQLTENPDFRNFMRQAFQRPDYFLFCRPSRSHGVAARIKMSNATTSMDSSLSGHSNDTVDLSSRSVDSRLVCS